jgi:hypothetical protein
MASNGPSTIWDARNPAALAAAAVVGLPEDHATAVLAGGPAVVATGTAAFAESIMDATTMFYDNTNQAGPMLDPDSVSRDIRHGPARQRRLDCMT